VQFTLKQLLAAMTGVAVLAALAADGYCELAILAVLLTGFGLILRRLAGRRRQKRRYHKAAFESLLLVIVAALILPSATTTAIWDGRARVSLTFIVTEQESGNPVSGARVEIGQAPLSAFRLEAQAATDSQGRATINITLPASGRDRLCEHTGYASLGRRIGCVLRRRNTRQTQPHFATSQAINTTCDAARRSNRSASS
jgi:hypothetical protein